MIKRLMILLLVILMPITAFAWQSRSGGFEWQVAVHRSSAFTGATDDSHGDASSGTPTPTYTIFSVTGDVIIHGCWGVVNTNLTESGATATIEVGFAGNTAELIAQENAVDLDDGAVYVSGTVEDGGGALVVTYVVVNDGADIIETTDLGGTDEITAGQIDYYCIWSPAEDGATLTSDGSLS